MKKILVTSGYKKLQESKIKKTKIEPLFDEIIIDTLDDPEKRKGKTVILQELLEKHGWQPKEVLVVGDNPYSELEAARNLGIFSVQILRPTIEKADEVDYHIRSLCDLNCIIELKR